FAPLIPCVDEHQPFRRRMRGESVIAGGSQPGSVFLRRGATDGNSSALPARMIVPAGTYTRQKGKLVGLIIKRAVHHVVVSKGGAGKARVAQSADQAAIARVAESAIMRRKA